MTFSGRFKITLRAAITTAIKAAPITPKMIFCIVEMGFLRLLIYNIYYHIIKLMVILNYEQDF